MEIVTDRDLIKKEGDSSGTPATGASDLESSPSD